MKLVASILFAIVLALGGALPGANAEEISIDVVVSPPVISPASAGRYISVHTNIEFGDVDKDSVMVWIEGDPDPYEPEHVSADNRGYLYVTLERTILLGLDRGEYDVELTGDFSEGGDTFTGSDQVYVR